MKGTYVTCKKARIGDSVTCDLEVRRTLTGAVTFFLTFDAFGDVFSSLDGLVYKMIER